MSWVNFGVTLSRPSREGVYPNFELLCDRVEAFPGVEKGAL
ncbi:MAG: hypothetical protein H6Q54_2049 [Deltaproteobacteria bacterium]|nr:hypothetical protein [Deltaproteobacteria bacterium]